MLWDYDKYPRIELALNTAGRLILRKPGPNAVEANCFTKGQEQSLWRSIVKTGLDAASEHVTLFDGLQENGRLKAAEAAITRDSGTAKAYEAWQLAAFVPVHIEMRVNYAKPQLTVMNVKRVAVPKVGRPQAPVLSLIRVDVEGDKPQKP